MEKPPKRLTGVDAFRMFAAFSVIFIHVGHFNHLPSYIGIELRLFGRWAVPFFFIVSGYFIAPYILNDKNKIAFQAAKTILVLAISSLLIIPLMIIDCGATKTIQRFFSFALFTNGLYFHMWFLNSLIIGLMGFYVLQVFNLRRTTSVAILCCLGVMIFDAYYPGKRPVQHFARHLMCFPFLYFGMLLRWTNFKLKTSYALFLLISGILIQNLEALFLLKKFDKPPINYDFLIGTIPFAIGAFLFSRNLTPSVGLNVLSKFGRTYSLGIYIFHPFFISLIKKNWAWDGRLYSIFVVPLTFIFTLIFLIILFKIAPAIESILGGNPEQIQRTDKFIPLPSAFLQK